MKIKLFTIPNLITLLNLLSGCLAAFFAFRGQLQIAFWLVCASAVFDFLDGFAARLLKAYSPVGKQLDSLADMISFGFVPSVFLMEMYQSSGGSGYWSWAMFLLAAFSALRLAKFNVDESQTEEFRGLPTPACTLLVCSAGYLQASGNLQLPGWLLLSSMAVLCALLICDIRMFSFKHVKKFSLPSIFICASGFAIGFFDMAAVPVVVIAYILISTVRHFTMKAAS